jgi:hypothetical protein
MVTPMRAGLLRTPEVLRLAGCSYRQLDHWCRTYQMCEHDEDPGSGHARRFTWAEAKAFRCLTVLGRHGVMVGSHATAILETLRANPSAGYLVIGTGGVTPHGTAQDATEAILGADHAATVVCLAWDTEDPQ